MPTTFLMSTDSRWGISLQPRGGGSSATITAPTPQAGTSGSNGAAAAPATAVATGGSGGSGTMPSIERVRPRSSLTTLDHARYLWLCEHDPEVLRTCAAPQSVADSNDPRVREIRLLAGRVTQEQAEFDAMHRQRALGNPARYGMLLAPAREALETAVRKHPPFKTHNYDIFRFLITDDFIETERLNLSIVNVVNAGAAVVCVDTRAVATVLRLPQHRVGLDPIRHIVGSLITQCTDTPCHQRAIRRPGRG